MITVLRDQIFTGRTWKMQISISQLGKPFYEWLFSLLQIGAALTVRERSRIITNRGITSRFLQKQRKYLY